MFPIRGKNDELIVSRRLRYSPALGAVLGIELKKRLSPGALLQAQAEWLLYAPKSMFPYIQVSCLFLLLACSILFPLCLSQVADHCVSLLCVPAASNRYGEGWRGLLPCRRGVGGWMEAARVQVIYDGSSNHQPFWEGSF